MRSTVSRKRSVPSPTRVASSSKASFANHPGRRGDPGGNQEGGAAVTNPATSPVPDAGPLALTAHELRYLVSLEDSAVAAANGQRLGLTTVAAEVTTALVGAGAASMLVRGLAFIRDDRLTLTDETG